MQQWMRAMRRGDFDRAVSLSYDAMLRRDPARRNDPRLPFHQRWVWDGRAFEDRNVLVRCYHGLGDTIQFARYLPSLATRAASVTVEMQPRLIPLLGDIPGVDRVIAFDPARPTADSECDLEITELAMALVEHPARLPPPYLRAYPAPLPSGLIGLCHAAGDWDPDRSIPASLFRPLCERHRCLTLVAEPSRLPVLNPGGCPFDMACTIALVAGVDLVITVDTMIAHLAGAMGKPTWLLLKAEPDWRWSPDESSSVWYPSMRLYAQPRAGDWTAVLERVESDLAEAVKQPASPGGFA